MKPKAALEDAIAVVRPRGLYRFPLHTALSAVTDSADALVCVAPDPATAKRITDALNAATDWWDAAASAGDAPDDDRLRYAEIDATATLVKAMDDLMAPIKEPSA